MKQGTRWQPFRLSVGLGVFACLGPGALLAGTTGKISGEVLDVSGRAVAATVQIVDRPFGAESNEQGRYAILNIPPGTYDVTATALGYETVRMQQVIVSADETTALDFVLGAAGGASEEVVVIARRPPVDVGLTSTKTTLRAEEIELLPVQDLDDIVNLQAGVVDGHFRGGRRGEVQYQVNGVSVNNAYDNLSTLSIDRSLLQEVQVISGTFDAEFGQAMSGVVNAILKSGTDEFQWNAEAFIGDYVFDERGPRLVTNEWNPLTLQNYQGSISGPFPPGDTVYLLSARRFEREDYVQAKRNYSPSGARGDSSKVPLGYSEEWSGVGKVTNRSLANAEISYEAILNWIEGRRSDYTFRFNPEGLSLQETFSVTHGLTWSHTFGPRSYLDFSVRQNYFLYEDQRFDDVFIVVEEVDSLGAIVSVDSIINPGYSEAGPPREIPGEPGIVVQGVELTRFRQKTNDWIIKSSLVNQITLEHQLQVGAELNISDVEFGNPEHLVFTTDPDSGTEALTVKVDEPPDFPPVRTYRPIIAAAYAQDNVEWTDFSLRAGLRMDYFDARAQVPSDLANPANAIAGAPESRLVSTSKKIVLAPRLGVAYPVGSEAALHFSYGHFYQFPGLGQVFSNADYAVLRNLQAGGADFGILGNPDIEPEKTVQYQFGYKQALNVHLGFDVTVFFKDIRNLLGVEFIETYNGAEYTRFSNADIGDVLGLTVSVDHHRLGPASISLDYTWQRAIGNSSDPRETATRAQAGEDPRPRLVPFDWDQRHTLNLSLALSHASGFTGSAILRVASGQPYTPVLEEGGFGSGLEANSGRKESAFVLDFRAEQSLGLAGTDARLFARVFNAFDARFFNGFVFNSTGSADFSRFPERDRVSLDDPTRFLEPRRIEFGIRLGSGGG